LTGEVNAEIGTVMQNWIDSLIRGWGQDPGTWPWTQFLYLAFMGLFAFIVINFAAITAGIFSWAERRVAARMQSRVGPNRVGPFGFLQWIADAVKLLLKEDLVPTEADSVLFRAAPYFMMVGFACVFVCLPFSHTLIVADMNIGIFYILAVTALIVVGIIMSGWSSNSKWSLFGAIRSAAQIISYEIPAGMALMIPVMLAGTLSTQGIIRAQGGFPWQWFIFDNPAAFAAFFIYFISALAEGNRTPFDLPEAESELVSGYNTEYSGMRFSYFFLVEWGNMWIMSALATTMFLGGWQLPGLSPEKFDALSGGIAVVAELASLALFAGKTLFFVFVVMWLRWTLPRIRVDQMMNMCWKYLVPMSFAGVIFVAGWMLAVHAVPVLGVAMRAALFLAGAGAVIAFALRTMKNLRDTGDKFDFTSNW
jgi:NADH-quinone oxidoreductase subunit H